MLTERWLKCPYNPQDVVALNKVTTVYPWVLKNTVTREKPYRINISYGPGEDDYLTWEYLNIVQWKSALLDLGLGELWDKYYQLAVDAGRAQKKE